MGIVTTVVAAFVALTAIKAAAIVYVTNKVLKLDGDFKADLLVKRTEDGGLDITAKALNGKIVLDQVRSTYSKGALDVLLK